MDLIGDWYAKKAADARRLREEIRQESAQSQPDAKKLRKLRQALELAEYVGD
jgi:hypothetical protein